MNEKYKDLLVKNILGAVSMGIIVNVGLTNPVFANEYNEYIDKTTVQEDEINAKNVNNENADKKIDKEASSSNQAVPSVDKTEKIAVNNTDEPKNISVEQNENISADDIKKLKQISNNDIFTADNNKRDEIREAAVIKAREGLYDEALPVLKQLYTSDKSDRNAAYDYMAVSNWSGNFNDTIQVYEENDYTDLPDFAVMNVASAYYRAGRFDKAAELLQPLADKNDKEATVLLAQTYLKDNKVRKADDIYDELLIEYPDDMDICLNRALSSAGASNWKMAARDWHDVLDLYERKPTEAVSKDYILDNLSVAYIQLGRYDEATKILKPYIDSKTALPNMVGNYMIILNNTKKFKQVPALYEEYFSTAPATLFVKRELANSYVLDEEYVKAVEIYNDIVNSPNVTLDDRMKLGYYGCLSGSGRSWGMKAYRDILNSPESISAADRILQDAYTFLHNGYYRTAKEIYYELINYDKRYHDVYAGDLFREYQYLTSLREYNLMLKDKDTYKDGLEGIVKVSTNSGVRDYSTAEHMMNAVFAEKNKSQNDYNEAEGNFINRRKGEATVEVVNSSDHTKTDQTDIYIAANEYLGNGFWGEAQIGKTFIKDSYDGKKAHLNTSRVGFRYTGKKWNTLFATNMFGIDGDNKNGLYIDTVFKPTDRQRIDLTYSYEPIYDANALDFYDDPVFGDNYTVRYTYNVNPNEEYYVELSRSDYDDGNDRYGWDFGQYLMIYDDVMSGKSLERIIHWGRDRYSNQDVPYYSPKYNETVGGEWRWGKTLSRTETIYNIVGVEWAKDYPDDLTLNPYIGFEYDKNLSNREILNIGFIYGLRSGSWLGEGDWRYNKKEAFIMYNLTW